MQVKVQSSPRHDWAVYYCCCYWLKNEQSALDAVFFGLITEYITVGAAASVILQCLLQRCLATDGQLLTVRWNPS